MKRMALITTILIIWITISADAEVVLRYHDVGIHGIITSRQYRQVNEVNVTSQSRELVNCPGEKSDLILNTSDTSTGNTESNHTEIGFNGYAIYFYGNGKTFGIKVYDDSGSMITTFQLKNTKPGSRYHVYPYSCLPPVDHNIYFITVSTDTCSNSFKFLNNKPVEYIEDNLNEGDTKAGNIYIPEY